jgi:hypothetical protein
MCYIDGWSKYSLYRTVGTSSEVSGNGLWISELLSK